MSHLLPLDSWRRILGFNPWHFNGLVNAKVPVTSACNTLTYKYSWQNADAAGRNEVEAAIELAESRIAEWTGFSVAPHYVYETIKWPQYPDKKVWRVGWSDRDDHWISIRTNEGKVQAVGVEAKTLLGTPAVAYSDADGDGLKETFVITQATTVTDPTEIAIYVPAAKRLNGEGATDDWRIQPVSVSISGGVATIRGNNAWIMVDPILYEGFRKVGLDPDTATNFLSTVEVYRRYTDPDGTDFLTNSQATMIWETMPYPSWACCATPPDSSRDPASVAYALGRVGIRDSEMGILTPARAVFDAASGTWSSVAWWDSMCRPADRVLIRYLAGNALDSKGRMDNRWQVVVARLAAAEMVRPICACNEANRELYRWQFDLSRAAGANDEQYRVPDSAMNNPLGQRAGHVFAWNEILQSRHFVGMLA